MFCARKRARPFPHCARSAFLSVMLTGDNGATAARIADAVRPSHYEHSLQCLTRSSKKSSRCAERVTMSAWSATASTTHRALATADCSVAMGALGSDVAVETASVALMSSDIRRLPGFIALLVPPRDDNHPGQHRPVYRRQYSGCYFEYSRHPDPCHRRSGAQRIIDSRLFSIPASCSRSATSGSADFRPAKGRPLRAGLFLNTAILFYRFLWFPAAAVRVFCVGDGESGR